MPRLQVGSSICRKRHRRRPQQNALPDAGKQQSEKREKSHAVGAVVERTFDVASIRRAIDLLAQARANGDDGEHSSAAEKMASWLASEVHRTYMSHASESSRSATLSEQALLMRRREEELGKLEAKSVPSSSQAIPGTMSASQVANMFQMRDARCGMIDFSRECWTKMSALSESIAEADSSTSESESASTVQGHCASTRSTKAEAVEAARAALSIVNDECAVAVAPHDEALAPLRATAGELQARKNELLRAAQRARRAHRFERGEKYRKR